MDLEEYLNIYNNIINIVFHYLVKLIILKILNKFINMQSKILNLMVQHVSIQLLDRQ